MDKPKVLFLCTGNSARSQIAEAFLRKYGGDRYHVLSAGLDPKGIHPYTITTMEEIGVSLEGQRSKDVKEYLGKDTFQFFITVCGHAEENCPHVFLTNAGKHLHWHFDDPAAAEGTEAQKLKKFREVRDLIEERIQEWLGLT